MLKNQRAAYFYAIVAIFFWSTVATAFKISLQYVSPLQLLFYASLVSTLIIGIFIIFNRNKLVKFSKHQIFYSSLLGLINPFIYYLVLFKAYDLLPAQIAQPLNYSWPIVLSVFSVLFLHQKFRFRLLISIIISFIGIILLSLSRSSAQSGHFSFLGIFLALASAFIWATYWILNMKRDYPIFEGLFLNFSFGTMYSLILILSLHNSIVLPNLKLIFSLAYVGTFEMGLTFIFWFKALSYSTNTSKISNLIYISPFLSLVFIHYILGEVIRINTIYGLTFIIAGIFIQSIKRRENFEKE